MFTGFVSVSFFSQFFDSRPLTDKKKSFPIFVQTYSSLLILRSSLHENHR